MAFVFQQAGSPFWFADFRGPDGKRLRKSTKLRADAGPKKKAETFAQRLEQAADDARQGTLTEVRAREAISEIVRRTTGKRLAFHGVETWLRSWLAEKEATNARATFLAYRKAVNEFLAHLGPERAARGLELVTPDDVRGFRDSQVKQGKTPQTANNLLKALRIPFALAHSQGFIPTDPTAAKIVKTLPKEGTSRSVFTAPQLAALVTAADEDWRGMVLFSAYTGQRLSDVANLRWGAVNLAAGEVAFVQGKTKRHVSVPLHLSLTSWLQERQRRAPGIGKAHVFPQKAGRGTGGGYGLSGRFRALMAAAGIVSEKTRVRSKAKGSKGRTTYALSHHSLRHTFNSALANAGVSQELRQALTGHASAEMNKIYTHHERERVYGDLQAGRPIAQTLDKLEEMGVLSADVRSKMEELSTSGRSGSEVWEVLAASFQKSAGAMKRQTETLQGLQAGVQQAKPTYTRPLRSRFGRPTKATSRRTKRARDASSPRVWDPPPSMPGAFTRRSPAGTLPSNRRFTSVGCLTKSSKSPEPRSRWWPCSPLAGVPW